MAEDETLLGIMADWPWDKIISQVLILVAVFLGGWVSPWVTSRLSMKKDKRLVRAMLIESINTFYAVKIETFFSRNRGSIAIADYNHNEHLLNGNPKDEERKNLERTHASLVEIIHESKKLDSEYITKRIENKSKIYGLLAEAEMIYGFKKYKEAKNIVDQYLFPSSEKVNYYDWIRLPYDEFRIKKVDFPRLHDLKKSEFHNHCSELTDGIMNILK